MTKKPDLSVIVACYNVAPYISECLNSIINTQFPYDRLEVIPVDDGSTDKTGQIIDEIASQYSFIKPIHKHNGGVSSTRNCGIEHANGKYIAFVDGDDIVPPNAYSDLMYAAERYHSNIVSGFVRRFDDLRDHGSWLHQFAIHYDKFNTTIARTPSLLYDTTVWNKVYKLSFIKQHHLYFTKNIIYEDLPLMLRAQLDSDNSSTIKSTVYYWRWRTNSITESRNAVNNYLSRIASLNRCRDLLFHYGYGEVKNVLYMNFIRKVLTVDLPIFLQNSGDATEGYLYKIQEITYCFLRDWHLLSNPILHYLPLKDQVLYYAVRTRNLKLLKKFTYVKPKDMGQFRAHHFTKRYTYQPLVSDKIAQHLDFKHNTMQTTQSLSRIKIDDENHLIYGDGMFHIKQQHLMKKPLVRSNYHEKLSAKLVNIDTYGTQPKQSTIGINLHRQKTPLYKRVFRPTTDWTNTRYEFSFDYLHAEHVLGHGHWMVYVTDNIENKFIVHVWLGSPGHKWRSIFSPLINHQDGVVLSDDFTDDWNLIFNLKTVESVKNKNVNWVHKPEFRNGKLMLSADLIDAVDISPQIILDKDNDDVVKGHIERQFNKYSLVFNVADMKLSKPYQMYDLRLIHRPTNHLINYRFDYSVHPHNFRYKTDREVSVISRRNRLAVTYQYQPFMVDKYQLKGTHDLVITGQEPVIANADHIKSIHIELLSTNLKHRYLLKSQSKSISNHEMSFNIPLMNKDDTNLRLLKGCYHLIEYLTYDDGQTSRIGFDLVADEMDEASDLALHSKDKARYRVYSNQRGILLLKIYQPMVGFTKHKANRALAYSVLYPLMRLLPINKKTVVFDSYWASQFSSNEKAIYKYMNKHYPDLNLVWFLKNDQLPIDGDGKRVRVKSLKYWYYLATAKYLFQNTNMPNQYFKRPKQIETETLHGTFLKHMGFNEPHFRNASQKIQDNFARRIRRWDYMVVPSAYMRKTASRVFDYHQRIIPSGFPRNDSLAKDNNREYIKQIKEKLHIPLNKKVILYAPTYRKHDPEFHFDLNQLQKELSDKYVFLVRLHYFVAHSHSFYGNPGFAYDVSDYPNINDLLLISDVMITDYSSIMFDYAYLKKPMIFYAFDEDEYLNDDTRGVYLDYQHAMPGPIVKTQDEVVDCLKKLPSVAKKYQHKLDAFSDKFAQYGKAGTATAQVAKTVLNTKDADLDQEPDKHVIFNKFWHWFKIQDLQATLLNYLSRKLPKKNIIMFDSFFGTQYSDNPKALYLYIKNHYPEYKCYWNVNEEDVPFFRAHHIPYVQRFSYKGIVKQAEAKYWIVNARRPFRWHPGPGTTVLQTWHGTPLKTIGADVSLVTMPSNNAKKYHKQVYNDNKRWNYLLAPNLYSARIMQRAFRMQSNQMMLTGYPRNDILVNHNDWDTINKIKKSLHIPLDKKVVLYAPTWRDDEFVKSNEFIARIHLDLDKIKKHYGNKVIVLVRTHYMIANQLDLSKYKGSALNVSNYPDIAELYLISDVLITDYSSVMFDYSILHRPMIFFDYDFKNYAETTRGFYFDFRKVAPGPIVTTTDGVIEQLDKIFAGNWHMSDNYKRFIQKFDKWMDGKASARVCHELFSRDNVKEVNVPRKELHLPEQVSLTDGATLWDAHENFKDQKHSQAWLNYNAGDQLKFRVLYGMRLESTYQRVQLGQTYVLVENDKLKQPAWVGLADIIK